MNQKLREIIANITPILISPKKSALTISLSKRFFLFKFMNNLIREIDEDPHLNFLSLLKSYKILGKFLHGNLSDFFRDRNKIYFKNFFYDKNLWQIVKNDIEYFYPKYKDIKMTITKRGLIIYDNYKKQNFNVFLMTIHSGTWIPKEVGKKMLISEINRYKEEDIDSHKIYAKLVLEKSGIWIDNKQSRYLVDFNRGAGRAIYFNHSEKWLKEIWCEELNKREKNEILSSHRDFYFMLSQILESYNFNIIFDGHTMKNLKTRPNISFGTKYIPLFYLPIVKSMQRKMISLGYSPVSLNNPYKGGHILKWLSEKFPNIFIFSMEVNKKLYMTKDRLKVKQKNIDKISNDICDIFNLELDGDIDETCKCST
jgi:N-formylglutamate amidohydrolase